MNRMFKEVTETWNPLEGECPHHCSYCWARKLIKRHNMAKYRGEPRIIEKEMKRKFKDGSFVFVQDMSDLFANGVPTQCIIKILKYIEQFPNVTFLLLTKNPKRYHEFNIPKNCICGCTIETNREYHASLAPSTYLRLMEMWYLGHPRKMISIEPIMDFDLNTFVLALGILNGLEFVYIGYDNYNNHLPEPSLDKTMKLIRELETFTEVRTKTLREKWDK